MERYLGDGVYATYDGYNMTLDLRAEFIPGFSRHAMTKIVLEPQVFDKLIQLKEDCESVFA